MVNTCLVITVALFLRIINFLICLYLHSRSYNTKIIQKMWELENLILGRPPAYINFREKFDLGGSWDHEELTCWEVQNGGS